jgi:hypothetical protein
LNLYTNEISLTSCLNGKITVGHRFAIISNRYFPLSKALAAHMERNVLLKSRELEIPEDNPFLNDVLNRKENAEALTEFVLSTDESLVVCIDAPWGQGKTTFLRMWEKHLKNNNIPTLYFNAWESDFSDDALVCLIGEISASINELSKHGNESKAQEYLDKAKDIGVTLLKRSIPIAAKVATAGALDLDKITEHALAGFAETIAKEQLEHYERSKSSLKAFRTILSEFTHTITDPDNPKPLIFIIDELDRCRPNYSIEILEKAKHFFNVDNIIFVLGADKKQLGSSIKAIYGSELNVNGYLRRFIDIDYILPPPDQGLFIKALFLKFSFNEYFSKKGEYGIRDEGEQALTMFAQLFELYGLTLREQEHCCSLLSISIRTTPPKVKLFPLFLCFLIVLKVTDSELYYSLVTKKIKSAELLERFRGVTGAGEVLLTKYGTVLEAYIVTCTSPPYDYEDVTKRYHEIQSSPKANDKSKRRAERIVSIIESFNLNYGAGSLDSLLKKIEVASHFEV